MAKSKSIEMVVTGVLSYVDLVNPKPFKNTIKYKTDIILEKDDDQISHFSKMLNKARKIYWGEDKSEWPKRARGEYIKDGDERQDQANYQDKMYLSVTSKSPVQACTPEGEIINIARVKSGMVASVSISFTRWENDGEEGLSIYIQGIMIDPDQEPLPGFGGRKSLKALFGIKDSEGSNEDDSEDEIEDEDDMPVAKKKKKAKKSFDDEEDDE